ncbi:MAG: M20/M25/M40 family metallo-hydrolase [Candidatus Zixiibacteriota bacterium]|nr:MAG: M20/M25/M40 family metallo-hydrolase [candidate division Zixibacteria bacterium]
MNKRLFYIGIMAGVVFYLFTGSVSATDGLIAFDRSQIEAVRETAEIRVIAKLDDLAVALVESGNLEKLQKAERSIRLIESPVDIDRLWVMRKNDGIQNPPGVLVSSDNYHLLSITFNEATELMSRGAFLSKCQDINLPADRRFSIPAKLPSRSLITTDIDSLMALVSVDSVTAYIQRLQDFQTRYTCTDSFWTSGSWVASKFASWGYDSLTFQEYDTPFQCLSRNVIATKIGDVNPDRFIIVGGHYDAVVYDGGNPAIWAPGADDNGTGTAMTMEIARVLADLPFKKSVRFITFGAEEQGLIGSWYYVVDALNREEDIAYMINADMIGNVSDSFLDFVIRCSENGEHYGEVIEQLAIDYTTLAPNLQVGEWSGSDHFPFQQAGFRTIYSAEGDFSPNWHTGTDIIDNIDPAYAADIIRVNLGALVLAIESPVPVTGLQAYNVGDGETVYLEWDLSPDIDIIGYELYFGTCEENIIIYDTSYTSADTAYGLFEDSTYYFGVSSFALDGGTSLIENFVGITPRSIPSRADTLTVMPEFYQNHIQWSAIPDLDFDYYQLYRKIGENGNYQPHQQIPDPEQFEYIDQNLQSNLKYYYYVTLVDSTGLEGEASHEDYARVLSFDSGILFVDETRDFTGGQGLPTDAQQDSFFQLISSGYAVTFHDYIDDGSLRINDLGPYSTVVWIDDDAANQQLDQVDSDLAHYLDVGGNLLFVGWRAFFGYSNIRPLSFDPGSFPYDYLFINSVNSSNTPDFIGATGVVGWPDLGVMPERVIPQWNGMLIGVDVMELQDVPTEIYYYISSSGDTLYDNKPVGIAVDYINSSAVYLTFPLFPVGEQAATNLFISAMNYLGETTTDVVEVKHDNILPEAFLWQNYPNPFNAETSIKFMLNSPGNVRLGVYNVLGQEVEVLVDRELPAGIHLLAWSGENLPSGIYFYRLTFDNHSVSRRMILLR